MYKFLGMLGGFIMGILFSAIFFSFHGYSFGVESLISCVMVFFVPQSETGMIWLITIPSIILGIYLGHKNDKKVVKF